MENSKLASEPFAVGKQVVIIGAGNTAQRRNITLGDSTALLAVVTSGLKAGETVVADGVQRVKPGAPVKPVPYTPPNYGNTNGAGGTGE